MATDANKMKCNYTDGCQHGCKFKCCPTHAVNTIVLREGVKIETKT